MVSSLGLNKTFAIKNANGTSFHNLVLRKSAYDSVVMALNDKITGDVYYKDNKLAVTMQEYIEFDGVKFVLVNPPTIVREGLVSENGSLNGMTKYSFVFYHPMYLLSNFPFADVAVTSDQQRYLSESKTFSWIGYPDDFIAKLNKNLEGTQWMVVKSDRFPQDIDDQLSQVMQFDDITVAEALKKGYEEWGVPYVVDKVVSGETGYSSGKRFKVIFGLPSNEIYENSSQQQLDNPYIFQMGKGVGLKNNSRTPRNNKIITRIAGYGSEDNIPYGYPQIVWTGNQEWEYTIDNDSTNPLSYPIYDGIVGGQNVKLIKHPFTRTHLMPSIFSELVNLKVNPLATGYNPTIELKDYYDAISDQTHQYPNEIIANAPSYEIHEFEDIKPELDSSRTLAITGCVPLNADLTPASSWDDTMDEEGNYVQSFFQMTLPALGFDIYACAAITQEMQINMRGGACLGCTFYVQVDWDDYKLNFYDSEGNFAPTGSQRDYTKYPDSTSQSINIILKKENSTFGTLMPNRYQYPQSGDIFVVLGISLPLTYITNAEQRLDEEMKSYMLENNVHYWDYPLKFDEKFLADNTYILGQLKPNSIVHFKFGDENLELFVKQLTIKYGEKPLPQYDITLTDNIEAVLNQIGQVADDVEKLSSLISILRQNYSRNVWSELAKKLSKTQDDTAQGFIKFIKGLQVGNQFVSGLLGEGGIFNKDTNGKTYIETDKLYVRMKAYFDTVEIRKYLHSGGNRIASVAGAKIVRVEGLDSNGNVTETAANIVKYRCYFRGSDGDAAVSNDFVIGDQVYCHITNVTSGSSLYQHHYWRLCVGKSSSTNSNGEHYIDLSNRTSETISSVAYSGYQTGSDVPLEQDDIIQLGNVNDSDRRGAIVEYVSGNDAPSYQIFQGLGDIGTASTIEQKQAAQYTLEGKNYIGMGYDSSTGHAYMNVYGDMYIGAKPASGQTEGSTYIHYMQDDGTPQHNPLLKIKAKVEMSSTQSTIDGDPIGQYIADHSSGWTEEQINALIHDVTDPIQSQIDGEIDTWFYDYMPVATTASGAPANRVPLTNVEPYKTWYEKDNGGTASEVTTERDKHLGDIFYDNKHGYAFRFSWDEDNSVFQWVEIQDSAVIKALDDAAQAQDTADHKRRIFVLPATIDGTTYNYPYPPYDVGDLWVNAKYPYNTGATYDNEILKCKTAKASSGSFAIADWEKASKYTDDSVFNGYITQILNGTIVSSNPTDSQAAANVYNVIKAALGNGTIIDGGLVLTSFIGLRDSNNVLWSGINGEYDSNLTTGGIAAWYGGGMIDHEASPSAANYAKSLFRFDGSGYLAGGNITWTSAGQLTISDLYTMVSGDTTFQTDVLNKATLFANLFHSSTTGTTVGTLTRILPQAPFQYIDIKRGSDTLTEYSVLNRVEMDSRYIRVDFFNRLFQAYKSTTISDANKIAANDVTTTINNLKIMVGAWTDQYLSALGLDSSGGSGGGGTGDVTWEALASSADTHQIALSHFENALTGYAKLRQANDFVYNSNEVTFVPANYNSYLWLNYRAGTGTGTVSAYYMGNGGGSGGFASVVAASFVRNGGTSAQFLKADGSVDSNTYLTSVAFSNLTSHPTTLSGYGITDAKISNGTITLGSNSITPLTSESYTGTVTSVATGTGLTGGTITSSGTISINSTYQTYISHGESAYNSLSSYLPLTGGTLTKAGNVLSISSTNGNSWIYFNSTKNSTLAARASVGYYENFAFIANEATYARIGVNDSGTPQYWDNSGGGSGHVFNLIHSGNIASYNAGSATKLQTARSLWGNSFDGSADISGSMRIISTGSYYNEGIRMHLASNSWCGLVMCGSDNTGTLGTSAKTWSIHNNDGKFYIAQNGSSSFTNGISCVSGTWAILSSGNVGVGTTSPSYKLHVAGTLYASGAATLGSTLSVTGNVTTSGSFYAQGSNAGCNVSYDGISMGAGNYTTSIKYEANDKLKITAGTTYTTGGFYSNSYVSALGQNTSSDIRKKNVIGNVELDIEDIASAPSVKYLWKDKDLGLQAGSIAQYWQNVLPECVHTEMDGYLSMEYGVISLLSAISIARKVQNHEERIKDLEKENERLRTEVEQLRAA